MYFRLSLCKAGWLSIVFNGISISTWISFPLLGSGIESDIVPPSPLAAHLSRAVARRILTRSAVADSRVWRASAPVALGRTVAA